MKENIHIGMLSSGMIGPETLTESTRTGSQEEQAKNKQVFDGEAKDAGDVSKNLGFKFLVGNKQYNQIEYIAVSCLYPELFKLLFVK